MKAVTWSSTDSLVRLNEMANPVLKPGEVLVELHYAALNHLDLWTLRNKNHGIVLGNDGAGVIKAVSPEIDKRIIGKEVIINPGWHWGGDERFAADTFYIVGTNDRGTLAEYVAVPFESIFEKPLHLSLKEAAALPMAGVTAYRALFTKAKLKAGETVLITGAGGGVATSLLHLAVAAEAKVYVTSSSEAKIQKAIAIGAAGGFNYSSSDWTTHAKQLSGGFDVILDSAAGNGFADLTRIANEAARIISFGRTTGMITNLDPGIIFNKQLSIMGTLMGSNLDFESMIGYYTRYAIHPVIDSTFKLENISDAFERLTEHSQFGKIIVAIR